MNAPLNPASFPPNPSVGQRHGSWVWNGSRWSCSAPVGMQVIMTFFPASAPYTPSPGLVSVTAEGMGGGGGGGSAGPVPAGTTDFVIGGGGGGSGGYSKVTLPASAVLGGVNVVIGPGGTPGGQNASPGQIQDGTGGDGGPTSFGAMLVANGGLGGTGNNANQGGMTQNGFGGEGGAAGVGQIAWNGSPGFTGVYQALPTAFGTGAALQGGRGGNLGFAGGPNVTFAWNGQSANGVWAAANTGAGGGGSIISDVGGGPLEGGAGGSGWLLVTEYCWQGAPDDDDCGCPPFGEARVPAIPRYRPGGYFED
jgi:hypothetical protein